MSQPHHDESKNAVHSEPASGTPENRGDIGSVAEKDRNRSQDVMRLWAETGYFHDR
jgi:hypothetical protein